MALRSAKGKKLLGDAISGSVEFIEDKRKD